MAKNPPSKAGDMGSIPSLGRSHVLWVNQAPEPQLLSLCSAVRSPHTATEKHLLTTTKESMYPAVKSQSSPKKHSLINFKKAMLRPVGRAYLGTEGGGCLSAPPGKVLISESGVFHEAQHIWVCRGLQDVR